MWLTITESEGVQISLSHNARYGLAVKVNVKDLEFIWTEKECGISIDDRDQDKVEYKIEIPRSRIFNLLIQSYKLIGVGGVTGRAIEETIQTLLENPNGTVLTRNSQTLLDDSYHPNDRHMEHILEYLSMVDYEGKEIKYFRLTDIDRPDLEQPCIYSNDIINTLSTSEGVKIPTVKNFGASSKEIKEFIKNEVYPMVRLELWRMGATVELMDMEFNNEIIEDFSTFVAKGAIEEEAQKLRRYNEYKIKEYDGDWGL